MSSLSQGEATGQLQARAAAQEGPSAAELAALVHRVEAAGETAADSPRVSDARTTGATPGSLPPSAAMPGTPFPGIADVPDAGTSESPSAGTRPTRADSSESPPPEPGLGRPRPSASRVSAASRPGSPDPDDATELAHRIETAPSGGDASVSGSPPASAATTSVGGAPVNGATSNPHTSAASALVSGTSLSATTRGTTLAATVPSAVSPSSPGSVGREQKAGPQIRPVLAGRTGIQRRARSRPAPGGSSRDTVPSGLAGFAGTPTPKVAGPRRVEVPESVKQALRGSVGEPPTHVTVHEGDHAAEMTGAVNAEAFTRDGQIYLAGDAPLSSARGQELLAHELTHVIQQGGRNGSMPGEHTREGQDLESKALAVEQAMASGARETIAPKALARPSRDPETPELHHRHDGGPRDAPGRSSWTSPPPPPRPQQASAPSTVDAGADIQRRERDLRSSALSRGLGAIAGAVEHTLVSNIEQEVLGPPAAVKDKDSRYKRLERQAADLYPYIRARLRAELVRDRERRGRITRDWS